MIDRRQFVALSALTPLSCASLQNRYVTPEDLGWTPQTSPTDTTAIVNEALEKAAIDGLTYYDNAPRKFAGTIKITRKSVIEFGLKHEWTVDTSAIDAFEMLGSESETRARNVKRVFVNTAGGRGSIIRGPWKLIGRRIRNMSLAERNKLPSELVAVSATSREPSSEVFIENLDVSGFGGAFYQPPRVDGQRAILPYTRWRVGIALIRFCLNPITTAPRGNGFDDAIFDILRMSRNSGPSTLRGTDLNVRSLFCYGLNEGDDAEPNPVTLRKGQSTVNLDLPVGSVIAATGGRLTDGREAPFVSEVISKSGNQSTLADSPDADFTGKYVVDPPSINLANSSFNAIHAYFEGVHHEALVLSNGGKVSCLDLKISGGYFTSQSGYAIAGDGFAKVEENPRSRDNKWIRDLYGPNIVEN